MAGLTILSALGLLLVEVNPWGSETSQEYAKNATAKREEGDFPSAFKLYEAGYQQALETSNITGQLGFLISLGALHRFQYRYPQALHYWLSGRRLAEGHPKEAEAHGAILFNLASLYIDTSNFEAAQEVANEGSERLLLLRKAPYYASKIHLIHAIISSRKGSWTSARQHYAQAVASADSAGDDVSLSLSLNRYGMFCLDTGDWNAAEHYLLKAFQIRRSMREPYLVDTYLAHKAGKAPDQAIRRAAVATRSGAH